MDNNNRLLPYMDKSLSIVKRVDDLLSRMTVDEKAAQLKSCASWEYKNTEEWLDGNVGHYRTGNNGSAKVTAEGNNCIVKRQIEMSRLGIPPLRHDEALHGIGASSGTCFPCSTGLAAMFDDNLMYECANIIGKETAALGIFQVLSPVANITRDIRWGRSYETYGEDPYLSSRMTVAFVKGIEENGVIATPKHFVCNVGDGGRDSNEIHYSERFLREMFLPPFEAAVKEGKARGIMPAYNAIDGIPCHGNPWLLTELLRDEWGFDGIVVTDYGGIMGNHWRHGTSASPDDNYGDAYKAGIDVDLPDGGKDIKRLIENGTIPMELLDTIVKRILKVKFECGLFDNPYVDENHAEIVVHDDHNVKVALDTARKALVLLKNNNNVLPLKNVKRIGLFGPSANTKNLGGYSRCDMPHDVSPYEGIKKIAGGSIEILLNDKEDDPTALAAIAKNCDAAIIFVTIVESEGFDRNCTDLPVLNGEVSNEGRHSAAADDVDVNLIINTYTTGQITKGDQNQLIKVIAATGVPTVVVLTVGSPVTMGKWEKDVDAILLPWYGGEQGGVAIAEALFGKINPGGRTPFTFPKNQGQLPLYYNNAPSGRGYDYWDDDGKPQYAFGYGLSYTKFEYSDLLIRNTKIKIGENAYVSFKVKNVGEMAGDEVSQLYIHDCLSSVAKPLIELKGFKRFSLLPGEQIEVTLVLKPADLSLWNREMKFVQEPGEFSIMIGSASDDIKLNGSIFVIE
jgi:beta-glucosidase